MNGGPWATATDPIPLLSVHLKCLPYAVPCMHLAVGCCSKQLPERREKGDNGREGRLDATVCRCHVVNSNGGIL